MKPRVRARPSRRLLLPLLVSLLAVLPLLPLSPLTGPASAAEAGPVVTVAPTQAGVGGSVTVRGSGWRPRTLVMLLICGQSVPARGVIGGTNSCANADGRAVTTDADGRFSHRLPVAEPPVPCPCVVHAATATGERARADAVFQVAGHPVAALPPPSAGRLRMLSPPRLEGSGSLLTWFGAPPARTLVLTVGNVGTEPLKDLVFQVGTAHGVFAPQWEERRWRGTLAPGKKARVELPVELSAGAHGDYTVSVRYGGKVLARQPWGVGRPWGVTVFWVLLCLVVPVGVFRAAMAVVDRVRPRGPARPAVTRRFPARGPTPPPPAPPLAERRPAEQLLPEQPLPHPSSTPSSTPSPDPGLTPRPLAAVRRLTAPAVRGATALAVRLTGRRNPRPSEPAPAPAPTRTPTLPWFTPDTDPGPAGRLSAPHEDDRPTRRTTPTTPGRKGTPT